MTLLLLWAVEPPLKVFFASGVLAVIVFEMLVFCLERWTAGALALLCVAAWLAHRDYYYVLTIARLLVFGLVVAAFAGWFRALSVWGVRFNSGVQPTPESGRH